MEGAKSEEIDSVSKDKSVKIEIYEVAAA